MATTMVNAWLTNPQREWLLDEYLNKLSNIDITLVDDAYAALTHMKNHQFFN